MIDAVSGARLAFAPFRGCWEELEVGHVQRLFYLYTATLSVSKGLSPTESIMAVFRVEQLVEVLTVGILDLMLRENSTPIGKLVHPPTSDPAKVKLPS
jgi:hypothetical protein